ncbi:hypothetical protein MtrunA17_Chr1g0212101 [Medicago truncatula]|uniref:Uncharacterized protein n=1 Tax=Medicago truncatula TaxID=3880 RepID=A0A396K3W0_MEDTR|nr:hypothetical protein MtrunA17_Chr1g0212101 [Medicago truncatula]
MLCVEIDPYSALLCNPSIRKFKILPLINPAQNYFQTLFTLVYHLFTNNYNIIALCSERITKQKLMFYFGYRLLEKDPGLSKALSPRSSKGNICE